MALKINDLPKDLRHKALNNRQKLKSGARDSRLIAAFCWFEAPEGEYFWLEVFKKYSK